MAPDELTTDLMALSFSTEVAWLKLGKQPLAAGRHTLSFRLPKTMDAQGKPQRILFALDCLCLAAAEFRPYQFPKPGEDPQADHDREAASHVFRLPAAASPHTRVTLPLSGLWEICRHDERLPGEVAAPIKDFPAAPAGGDRSARRQEPARRFGVCPSAVVSHPYPSARCAGRPFDVLVFPANNLNTTIYVNGQYCGFDKNPFARLQFDVTKAVRPGVNEVWVGSRTAGTATWRTRRSDEAAAALEPAA